MSLKLLMDDAKKPYFNARVNNLSCDLGITLSNGNSGINHYSETTVSGTWTWSGGGTTPSLDTHYARIGNFIVIMLPYEAGSTPGGNSDYIESDDVIPSDYLPNVNLAHVPSICYVDATTSIQIRISIVSGKIRISRQSGQFASGTSYNVLQTKGILAIKDNN